MQVPPLEFMQAPLPLEQPPVFMPVPPLEQPAAPAREFGGGRAQEVGVRAGHDNRGRDVPFAA